MHRVILILCFWLISISALQADIDEEITNIDTAIIKLYPSLHASDVISLHDAPEYSRDRHSAYEIVHPEEMEEGWKLELPQGHRLDRTDTKLKTPRVRYVKKKEIHDDDNNVDFGIGYKTPSIELAAANIKADAKSMKTVRERDSFYIENIDSESKLISNLSEKEKNLWRNIATCLIGLCPLVALLVYFWKTNEPKPVPRFVVLTSTERLGTSEVTDIAYIWVCRRLPSGKRISINVKKRRVTT